MSYPSNQNRKQILTKEVIDKNIIIDKIVGDFISELKRAERKFPNWPDNEILASVNVAEEAGELLKACNEFVNEPGKYQNQFDMMEKEAIQTGAMALRFLLNLRMKKQNV